MFCLNKRFTCNLFRENRQEKKTTKWTIIIKTKNNNKLIKKETIWFIQHQITTKYAITANAIGWIYDYLNFLGHKCFINFKLNMFKSVCIRNINLVEFWAELSACAIEKYKKKSFLHFRFSNIFWAKIISKTFICLRNLVNVEVHLQYKLDNVEQTYFGSLQL